MGAGPLVLMLLVLVAVPQESVFQVVNGLSLRTGPVPWEALTLMGDGLMAVVFMAPLLRDRPRAVWGALLGAVVLQIAVSGFKAWLQLPRPPAVLAPDELVVLGPAYRMGSFPSGHTATAFLVASAIVLDRPRALLAAGLYSWATLVGLSRLVVGVHWPLDFVGGGLIGIASAWVGLNLAERLPWTRALRPRMVLGALLLGVVGWVAAGAEALQPGLMGVQRALGLASFAVGGALYARMVARARTEGG